jgi:dienelactone hydrolase
MTLRMFGDEAGAAGGRGRESVRRCDEAGRGREIVRSGDEAARGRGRGREIVRLDAAPSGSARAQVTSPALLGIADHRHAVGWWRDLRIDESVCGLATQRAQPTAVVIEQQSERWPVPVRGLLGCALAWNPSRPLVAGLAVSCGRAHPWVADYAARTVRTFEHVRAATSLTELDRAGGSPLGWLDEHTLVFLAARPRPDSGLPFDEPLIYEAAGPGFVSFEPGLDNLLAAAGAAVSCLHVGDAAVETLTRPLLVRYVQAHAGARPGVLVERATGLRDGAGGGAGRTALVWSSARLDFRTRPATLRPIDDGASGPAAPSSPVLARRPATLRPIDDGASGPPQPPPPLLARRSRPQHGPARASTDAGPQLSSSTRMLPAPGAEHPARLAVFPESATDRRAATLLWIRACRGPLDAGRPVPAPLPDSGTPTAILDLPLHWPADATLALLHGQIVAAVQAATEALDADQIRGARGRSIVVGGHSFGATLALYALAHVRGLAGAIAHSGCYNRTHTPFGFQYERRRYWDVPDIYTAFSALSFADRIRAPVLIVHGLEDANPATHPDQAADLYRAIVGTSGTARLILLPREEHNFRYRETHARLAGIHREWLERLASAEHPPTVVTADGR